MLLLYRAAEISSGEGGTTKTSDAFAEIEK